MMLFFSFYLKMKWLVDFEIHIDIDFSHVEHILHDCKFWNIDSH